MAFSKEDMEIEKAKERMLELDKKVDRNYLQGEEVSEWAKLSSKLTELEKMASLDLRQKSRIKWLVDGDENTWFFHGFVNNRNRKNHINGLLIDGI